MTTLVRPARLLGLALGAAQCARFSDERYVIDDAWISFRTARNVVEHGIFTFDATQPPVEGVTNLLWTLLSALGLLIWPDLEPALFARVLGGALYFGVLWIGAGLGARDAASPVSGALVTGVLLGAAGNLAFHALSGLESGLYLFLWALSLQLVGAAPRPWLLGLTLAALGMTRPEGVLLGGLTLGWAAWRWNRAAAPALVLWTLGIAGMEAFRLTTFGAWVPNTFHAKPPNMAGGWTYLARFALAVGVVGPVGAIVAARKCEALRVPLAVAGVLLAGAVWSGGDWMPGYRRATEAYFVLAWGAGVAFAGVGTRWAGGLALVAMLGGSGVMAWRGEDAGRYGQIVYGQVGSLLAASPGVDTVAAADIGRLGWYYPGSILDLGGLTDARWAAAGGWDEAYFRERDPDVLLVVTGAPMRPDLKEPAGVRGYERRPLAFVRAEGGYHLRAVIPLPGLTQMAVIARDDVVLSEEIWGPRP